MWPKDGKARCGIPRRWTTPASPPSPAWPSSPEPASSRARSCCSTAELEHAPLIRAIAEEAYRAGARYVDVDYTDPWVRRALVADGRRGVARLDAAVDGRAHQRRASRRRRRRRDRRRPRTPRSTRASTRRGCCARASATSTSAWLDAVMQRQVAWTIVAYPTEGWAREVFGEPDVEPAVAGGRARAAARRAGPGRRVARAPRASSRRARTRSPSARFDAMRYRGPGTELEVGLIEGARWMAGRERTDGGPAARPQPAHRGGLHQPAPDCAPRARPQHACRSRCAAAMVEGLELTPRGRRDRRGARRRAARTSSAPRLALDDGARRLGEVALVDALVARRRDRHRVPQHAVRRERRLAHRVGRGARLDGRRASTARTGGAGSTTR